MSIELATGRTDNSWIKHKLVGKPAWAQCAAYRAVWPDERILLIDGNAGDGIGVASDQIDLFDGQIISCPTPSLLADIADALGNADLWLCEKNPDKRSDLREQFPEATILSNHDHVAEHLRHLGQPYRYALWLSDPCGPSAQGVDAMRALGACCSRCDYVVILNEGSIVRMQSTKPASLRWATHRTKYPPMLDPQWWLENLNRRYLARTRVIHQSAGFNFRILVVANYLADAAHRPPFVEMFERR
jgi:hypothetical protein